MNEEPSPTRENLDPKTVIAGDIGGCIGGCLPSFCVVALLSFMIPWVN